MKTLDSLTPADYRKAFLAIADSMTENQHTMLKFHYDAPQQTVTAGELAEAVGFKAFNGANLQYGWLARKLCDFLELDLGSWVLLNVLVTFRHGNYWEWIMRPEVATALEQLRWCGGNDPLEEIEKYKSTYAGLDDTTRESVIKSRLGQGSFRSRVIKYWQGCAVTGCTNTEVLRAAHIKPWKCSTNSERLDSYNGLLLVPSLDAAFDLGLITFQDSGKIEISSELSGQDLKILGISRAMRIERLMPKHMKYLRFHRTSIFRA